MAKPKVDMSPEAVARRLEEVAQLYEVWLSFRRARPLGPLVPLVPLVPAK